MSTHNICFCAEIRKIYQYVLAEKKCLIWSFDILLSACFLLACILTLKAPITMAAENI